MIDFLLNSHFFGFTISVVFFCLAWLLQKKTKISVLNPLIISSVAIIIVMCVCRIDYSAYEKGGSVISFFLTPATICYAVPLYKQIRTLKKNAAALIIGIVSGCAAHAASVILCALIFRMNSTIYSSLLPKSITTAIGMPLSEEIGGIPAITVGAIMIAGLTGAIAAPLFCRLFRITEPEAMGIAIGTASHAIGTTKAFEIGEVQGAMSSLSIVITGLLTVIIVPFLNFM